MARGVAGVTKQASDMAVLIFAHVLAEALARGDRVEIRNAFRMEKRLVKGRLSVRLRGGKIFDVGDSYHVRVKFPKNFLKGEKP